LSFETKQNRIYLTQRNLREVNLRTYPTEQPLIGTETQRKRYPEEEIPRGRETQRNRVCNIQQKNRRTEE
jgi:hypothetical protein